VRLGETFPRLGEVAEERPYVGLLVVDEARQRLPLDQLHRDELHGKRVRGGDAVRRPDDVLSDLVDRHDVRVAEGGGGFRLEHEAPDPLLALDQLRRQDLECDVALEGLVLREVDLAHSSHAERSHDPVMRKDVFGLERTAGVHEVTPTAADDTGIARAAVECDAGTLGALQCVSGVHERRASSRALPRTACAGN